MIRTAQDAGCIVVVASRLHKGGWNNRNTSKTIWGADLFLQAIVCGVATNDYLHYQLKALKTYFINQLLIKNSLVPHEHNISTKIKTVSLFFFLVWSGRGSVNQKVDVTLFCTPITVEQHFSQPYDSWWVVCPVEVVQLSFWCCDITFCN